MLQQVTTWADYSKKYVVIYMTVLIMAIEYMCVHNLD